MEAAGRQPLLLRPALEGAFRAGLHCGEVAQPARFQLSIEASLPRLLARSRDEHPLPHRQRRLTARLGGQLRERNAAYPDLEVDAVDQRSGQAALIAVDHSL